MEELLTASWFDAETNQRARGLIDKRTANWDSSHCHDVLGLDKATLTSSAKRVNFYNATADSAYARTTQNSVVQNGSNYNSSSIARVW